MFGSPQVRKDWVKARQDARARSPFGVLAANGMNLRKSVNDPKSRLSRIVNFIRENGPATKRTILLEVFGKNIVNESEWTYNTRNIIPTNVTRGWGTYVFGLAVEAGILRKNRYGNRVYYSLGDNAAKIGNYRWV